MTDLLPSLLAPFSNPASLYCSSQESDFGVLSTTVTSFIDLALPKSSKSRKRKRSESASHKPQVDSVEARSHLPGLSPLSASPYQDLNSFLGDNGHSAQQNASQKSPCGPKGPVNSTVQQLETATSSIGSLSVSRFHLLCQEKGLAPDFSFDDIAQRGQMRFVARLKIGNQAFASDGSASSKKEAKAAVCEQAYASVQAMPARVHTRKDSGPEGGEKVNWVGKLLEFYMVQPGSAGPIYHESTTGPPFTCTVTIPHFSKQPLGDQNASFTNKKAAKAAAAQAAVAHLVFLNLLDSSGNVKKAPKQQQLIPSTPNSTLRNGSSQSVSTNPSTSPPGSGLVAGVGSNGTSHAARVQKLSQSLGLQAPRYELHLANPDSAAVIYNGAAYFSCPEAGRTPGLQGPIGQAYNLYGKKNAKEEVARLVCDVLEAERRRRVDGVLGRKPTGANE